MAQLQNLPARPTGLTERTTCARVHERSQISRAECGVSRVHLATGNPDLGGESAVWAVG